MFFLSLTYPSSLLGIVIEQKFMSTANLKHFYRTSFFVTVKRVLVCAVLNLPIILPIIMTKKTESYFTVLFLRYIFPALWGGF